MSIQGEIKILTKRVNDMETSLGKKVDWKWFFGALLTQIGILTAISSAVWTEVKTVRDLASQTNVNVAKIQGKLEPLEFIKGE
jgi:hypothetical protein